MGINVKNKWKVAGGILSQCEHQSTSTKTGMTFSVFVPGDVSGDAKIPGIYYLSGLTCTDENFCQKAGAFSTAAKHKVALILPDTSPRGTDIPGEHDSYDFGSGAGFYLNATEDKWSENYRMYDYVCVELPKIVLENFPIDPDRVSIMGHSMGGHGALTIAMKNPTSYKSVSAFAPICNPSKCPWGIKAFTGYLGADESAWLEYDSVELMKSFGPFKFEILLDQGSSDNFYEQKQLLPEAFEQACNEKGQVLQFNMQPGYDHSYYFISTFVPGHIDFHAKFLLDKES
eukprot:CAMPEP_0113969280 /NCGR_PEP_ID=MMETSP0011_2-20120614/10184_1 /TAXON_ID=101924 /ORGANISM="Rhodosorus marinus" /LENGTH=286 /DNA_ID=CAMNT_0000982829 /DNA_START=166 /DNA_END=1026 /DNA_ORIENTATION=+ /assembly_acc=CAM_ASM_000156